MYKKIAAAVVLVIVLATGVCQAQNFGEPLGARLRLQWEVEQAASGRPVITGHIYNDHYFWATAVHLLIEALDSSGRVISETIGYVDSWVPQGGRTYFEVLVPTAGARYRVTVLTVDWFGGRGGGS